jgi:hypothetical protein
MLSKSLPMMTYGIITEVPRVSKEEYGFMSLLDAST